MRHTVALLYSLLFLVVIVSCLMTTSAQAAVNANATIEGLTERYRDEVRAHRAYAAYAQQACQQGYPNIAHLFKSLSASEGVHARNFERHLRAFNINVADIRLTPYRKLGSTRTNLRNASAVEREEIDHRYPAIIERVSKEGHQQVIDSITHAWKAEKQHRDLIEKIYKASKRWFGLLVGRIEGGDSHYHICMVCGSTLNKVPGAQCPICAQAASNYKEIPAYAQGACKAPAQDDDW